MKIRTQLSLAFTIGGWMPLGIVAFVLSGLASQHNGVEQVIDHHVPTLAVAQAWKSYVQDAAVKMMDVVITDDQIEIKAQLKAIADDRHQAEQAMRMLNDDITLPEASSTLQQVLLTQAAYIRDEEKFIEQGAGNAAAAKKALLDTTRPTQVALIDALDRLIDFEKTAVVLAGQASTHQYRVTRDAAIGCAVLAFLVGSFMGAYVLNNIRNSLGGESDYAAEIARGIASGEFSMEIRASHGDQSSLLATLRSMRDNLLQIVSHVIQAADSVRQGTIQLSEGNEELTRRTHEQAAALTKTSRNMEDLTVSVKHTAENARQTTQRAIDVRTQAESGGVVVQQAVAAMADITASSKQIADIISIIDEIAFQTNLLALNAAVEAARAGEQGRGFAVVASEVRSLAQRSATAAKQIKDLIRASVDKVAVGSGLINESGKTLAQIIVGIRQVADVIAEIAAASEEQAAGIEEVNSSVAHMDRVTQQNSALVDYAAATSRDIHLQAENLAAKVAFFRTGGKDVGGAESDIPIKPAFARLSTPRLVRSETAALAAARA